MVEYTRFAEEKRLKPLKCINCKCLVVSVYIVIAKCYGKGVYILLRKLLTGILVYKD